MGPRARPTTEPLRPTPPARRSRRWLVVAAVVAAAGSVASAAAAPAQARPGQAEPVEEPRPEAVAAQLETLALAPESPSSPDDAFVAVVEADAAVLVAEEQRAAAAAASEQANVDLLAATVARDAAQVVEDDAQAARDAAREELAEERDRLSDLTAAAFVNGGEVDLEKYREIVAGDTSDPAAGRQIMFSQVLAGQQDITDIATADLDVAKVELRATRVALDEAQVANDAAGEEASGAAAALVAATTARDEAVGDADGARRTLRSAASGGVQGVPEAVPIIGLPRLSAADLATWFAGTAYSPRVSTPIEDYAAWFISEGAAEGIRGDIAFAQAVLETGGFANDDSVAANNFSGIGHCDSCPSGWVFGSPQLGVRAQIQLLKSYAVRTPNYANELVDRRLRGPAGCCATWGDLTTVWATDPTYGPKVMLIYSAIVQHALERRAAGLE